MKRQSLFLIVALLLLLAIGFVKCIEPSSSLNDVRGPQYAGASACITCHKNISDSFLHNSHAKTSFIPSPEFLSDLLQTSNHQVDFPNGQRVRVNGNTNGAEQVLESGQEASLSEKMEFAFGAGKKATSFGYWKNDQLFQLPLTYLSEEHLWTNSPGFPINKPYFTRPIIGRCFECHSSYINRYSLQAQGLQVTEKFNKASVILGIDCERCHGPAVAHVQFHQSNPAEKTAKFMPSIGALSRQQQLDLCATCHSGNAVSLQTIFRFKPGDTLSNYYMYYPGASAEPDVHGMQMQSLELSRCFQQRTLTCITCHKPHVKADNVQASFVAACLSCHQAPQHSTQMNLAQSDCISCHMPKMASKSLDFNNSNPEGSIPYKLHTHHIAIYPGVAKSNTQ